MLTWALLLCCNHIGADLLVRTVTVNNINYDDFSLLCAEGIPLLMEDHKPRPCQPRPWIAAQRCPAGFWCHEGDDESSYYCCPRSRKVSNLCHLPPATGFGKQLMRRFYYDWKTDGCHELHYTGIGGNENSYMTYESCESACRGSGEPTPKVFGGLSSNNKEDKKKPEKDKASKNKGPTISFTISSTENPSVLQSSKSTLENSIIPATIARKPSTASTHFTQPATIETTAETTTYRVQTSTTLENNGNPCTLPPERGNSGGIARKLWYFDVSSLSCVQFTYQGMGGNSNKFETSQECSATCGIGKPTRKVCYLPPAIGNGRFKIPRYYFDTKTQRCELFYFSGEDGNDNRFYKKHKCERLCLGKQSKKKEQTKQPETFTMPPTRFIESFVSSEPNVASTKSPTTFNFYTQLTTQPTLRATEIEIPLDLTRKPFEPESEHYEKLMTKPTPQVVEQLPETTRTTTRRVEVSTLFFTPPPTTPSSAGFIRTETVRPIEPQTFPTLVYVPKEEVPGSLPPYISPQEYFTAQKPINDLFNHLMTVQLPSFTQVPKFPFQPNTSEFEYTKQPQPPVPSVQAPSLPTPLVHSTGAPTIVEKSQIGPAPDVNVPLGNFPWETIPPGYTMPPLGSNIPQVYIPTPEQLEAMVKAMGVNAQATNHQIHNGPLPQSQGVPQASNVPSHPQPNVMQPIKAVEPPPDSLFLIPQPQRQWGTSSPTPEIQIPTFISPNPSYVAQSQLVFPESQPEQQIQQSIPPMLAQVTPRPQIGLPELPKIISPISSGNPLGQPAQPQHIMQPTLQPFVPVMPLILTESQMGTPGTLPPPHQQPLGSFQPHPGPNLVVNQVPTQTFTVNLTEPREPGLHVEIVTESPEMEFYPNINVSIVNELNSPCQMPVTDPDVVIMCEQDDVSCPIGSFCQIGLGQSICCPSIGGNSCNQPVQRGVGVAQLVRWYFNPRSKHCETFLFAGFQGNENNFLTYSECQNVCRAENPCERGQPVSAVNPDCSVSNRCPPESMCHSNGGFSTCCNPNNPVKTTYKPKIENDPCRQPINEGNGNGAHHRWAFDNNAGRCVSFIYQGENGNLNNFLTKNDCQAICGAPPTVPSRCLLPGLSGNGEEYLTRYFYSPEYRQCLHFIFSGQGGNENNFETQQDCLETCIANGVKFSSLASTAQQPTFSFSFQPNPICPQGSALLDANNEPMGCKITECPNGYVCTTMGPQKFCCPAPESFCLEPRPPVSVCPKGGIPVAQIRFTYDPLSDKCVRFSYEDCSTSMAGLNNFVTQPQCSRLCCNQGFNLLYRRKVRMMLNDEPMEETKRTKRV